MSIIPPPSRRNVVRNSWSCNRLKKLCSKPFRIRAKVPLTVGHTWTKGCWGCTLSAGRGSLSGLLTSARCSRCLYSVFLAPKPSSNQPVLCLCPSPASDPCLFIYISPLSSHHRLWDLAWFFPLWPLALILPSHSLSHWWPRALATHVFLTTDGHVLAWPLDIRQSIVDTC